MSHGLWEAPPKEMISEQLDEMLRNPSIAAFYGLQPRSDGRTPPKRYQAIVDALARAKDRFDEIESTYYPWDAFLAKVFGILEYRSMLPKSEYTPGMQTFIEDHLFQWWMATNPGEIIHIAHGMKSEPQIKTLLGTSPTSIVKFAQFLVWYRLNKDILHAVNYHAATTSVIFNQVLFLDAYMLHLVSMDAVQVGSLSLNSPAWYNFVKKLRDDNSIKLLPNQQEIADGIAVQTAVKRLAPTVYPKRPPEYNGWGFQEKFLWDLKNSLEFRERMFRSDKELLHKYDECGGVTDELVDWLRSRG